MTTFEPPETDQQLQDRMILRRKVREAVHTRRVHDLAQGWLRYEFVRTMSTRDFDTIFARSLKGENFDAMIDQLISES